MVPGGFQWTRVRHRFLRCVTRLARSISPLLPRAARSRVAKTPAVLEGGDGHEELAAVRANGKLAAVIAGGEVAQSFRRTSPDGDAVKTVLSSFVFIVVDNSLGVRRNRMGTGRIALPAGLGT